MSARILVTGGAGYIGSATVRALAPLGYEVIVLDDLSTGHIEALPANIKLIQGSTGDVRLIRQLLTDEPVETILHFAASIEAGESMRHPGDFIANNFINTASLIETAVQLGVRGFIFSSTAAVYRASNQLLSEESAIEPANVYGETKYLVERLLKWYGQIYGLRSVILRYFNAAGASSDGRYGEDHQSESHLIPRILSVALGKAHEIEIFGTDYPTHDGTCVRDYIHVDDLAAAHILVMDHLEELAGEVFNLGTGRGYSVREVVKVAREVTGQPIPHIDRPSRPGDAPFLVASSDKIRRRLGWQPTQSDLQTIISSAWEWHKRHPHGYRSN